MTIKILVVFPTFHSFEEHIGRATDSHSRQSVVYHGYICDIDQLNKVVEIEPCLGDCRFHEDTLMRGDGILETLATHIRVLIRAFR